MRILITVYLLCSGIAEAARFTSKYPCSDGAKNCISSGIRIVDGETVYRDCWEYSYSKSCNYPSLNNCEQYSHCYAVAIVNCLLHDSIGNCVNQKKEFSCKRWVPDQIESQKVRVGFEEKDGIEGLVCKGIPCIDGNCVDKSYQTNGEMMDSISKLYIASSMKDGKDLNFKLFEGFAQHCSKKATSYTNCCSTSKGWGSNLGANCNKNEQDLIDKRRKNLCVYVGKENKQMMGVSTVVKHHYCCFGNMLNKVIQVEGRKQLKKTFGEGGRADCQGLTLKELEQLNFDEMDFSEFIEDFKLKFFGKYKTPNVGDMTMRIKGSIPNIRKYDNNPNNKENNKTGWSSGLVDDSWEAEEERRIEEERKRAEAIRREQEKQLLLQKQKEQRIAPLKQRQKELMGKKSRLLNDKVVAEQKHARVVVIYKEAFARSYKNGGWVESLYVDYTRKQNEMNAAANVLGSIDNELRAIEQELRKIEQDLKKGNY
jgi:hypothetical protein